MYDKESHELLEDTQDVGPFMYIQGIGAFVPKVEEFLEGKKRASRETWIWIWKKLMGIMMKSCWKK